MTNRTDVQKIACEACELLTLKPDGPVMRCEACGHQQAMPAETRVMPVLSGADAISAH